MDGLERKVFLEAYPASGPSVDLGGFRCGAGQPLTLIAGPCVLEEEAVTLRIAREVLSIARRHGVNLVFKASFDKANRTSKDSSRGPGLERGLPVLSRVKSELGVLLLTDVHLPEQASVAAGVVDVLQIPAFLCRQTDLVQAAARTGKPVNLKKGQFLAPRAMRHVVEKARDAGGDRLLLTERGTSFGYDDLIVDMRGLSALREVGVPVVFDATHSVQRPGGLDASTGGDRTVAPVLARAAAAAGVDAVFAEVHEDPDRASSDGPNSLTYELLDRLLGDVVAVRRALGGG